MNSDGAREIDGELFSDIVTELGVLPEDGTLVLADSVGPEPLSTALERPESLARPAG